MCICWLDSGRIIINIFMSRKSQHFVFIGLTYSTYSMYSVYSVFLFYEDVKKIGFFSRTLSQIQIRRILIPNHLTTVMLCHRTSWKPFSGYNMSLILTSMLDVSEG